MFEAMQGVSLSIKEFSKEQDKKKLSSSFLIYRPHLVEVHFKQIKYVYANLCIHLDSNLVRILHPHKLQCLVFC